MFCFFSLLDLCGEKVDEKKLTEQIETLKKEKNDTLTKMSELQKQVSDKENVIEHL